MKDAREWAEKLRREAEECRLISKNPAKREMFARLAEGHDRHADDLEALMASGDLQDVQWQDPENNCN